MNYYKIKYVDDTFIIVKAKTSLEVIKKYDLTNVKNIKTRIIQLQGEQLAIAENNNND